MRAFLLTALVVCVVGCRAPASGGQAVVQPTVAPTGVPTRLPIVNVDDMTGMFPQQTVFVATPDHVSAITLLNHFTRYRITAAGVAQVIVDTTGRWLYLLDAPTAGPRRLRAFDVSSGSERAVDAGIADVAAGNRVLSTARDGRVLVLKSDARHTWVDAYAATTLGPLGAVIAKPGCGDRLLSSNSRVAILCLATGGIMVDDLRGNSVAIEGMPPALVAATMAEDGALYVATADHQLATVPAGMHTFVSVAWPSERRGSVLPDGLAIAQGSESAVLAQQEGNDAWLRVFVPTNTAQRRSLRLDGVPHGAILALWPFAYYTVAATIRHVDLTSGLLETMAEVGAGAVPSAVVNG